MNTKLIRIVLSAVLLVGAVVAEHFFPSLAVWQLLLIYLPAYLVTGYDVIAEAFEDLFHGEAFSEDLLMVVATVGALAIGFLPGAETEFAEAVFVMLFFQVGEMFEDKAEDNSHRSIAHLMNIRPDTANVERNGEIVTVHPETILVGETIVVKPGERIPLDGVVVSGTSSLDTSALTGESLPRTVTVGDKAVSGCINAGGVVRLKTEKAFGESTAAKIVALVENSAARKSRSETFIARFAHVYTPVVVGVAFLLAFLPPLFGGNFSASFSVWLSRALTFLVVSCPCALVISVPLTFFAGIGGASRKGILIKGGNYMEVLSRVQSIVFDKTGTLTKGSFEVSAVHPQTTDEKDLLKMAAAAERFSTHPIALSLQTACGKNDYQERVTDIEEKAGHGVCAKLDGRPLFVGNEKLIKECGAAWRPCHRQGTLVHIAIGDEYLGHIVISDQMKEDAPTAVSALKDLGVGRLVMLTGDKASVAESVAQQVGINDWYAELLPTDKVSHMERILHTAPKGSATAFVGDGINDAPVLSLADVGIAMGALGSDAAIEAADVVLMDDAPSKIAVAVRLARRTLGIAHQNVTFAISIKLLVLLLAALGVATMWMAVFADVGVTVLAVLNAMRALQTRNIEA